MYVKTLVALSACLVLFSARPVQEASAQNDDGSWWYVSYYSVPWAQVDSVVKLWDFRAPLREKAIAEGAIRDQKLLTHHTGTHENVVLMTEYASWDEMDDAPDFASVVFPDESDRNIANNWFAMLFGEKGKHRDAIYFEPVPASPALEDPDTETQAYWYATYGQRPWSRTDSLTSLWRHTREVVEEAKRNGSILDNMGMIHHTAGTYNVLNMAKYPSWEALETRSWNGAWRAALPDSLERRKYGAGYAWVNRDLPDTHWDFIYIEH